MKYLSVLFLLIILVGCAQTETPSEDKKPKEIPESLKNQIIQIDSSILYLEYLNLHLEELKLYTTRWVNEQSKSDAVFKKEHLDTYIKVAKQMKNLASISTEEDADKVSRISEELKTLFSLVDEITTNLLPDFASYEDLTNLFMATVLVEVDGELSGQTKIIKFLIEDFKMYLEKKKEKTNSEINKIMNE